MANNYALACTKGTSMVGIYVQVHGKKKARWQLLRFCEDFSHAKQVLREFDPVNLRQRHDLRAHHATGSANWMLFFTTYKGEPITSGKELGKLNEIVHPQQMAEVIKEE